MFGTNNYGGGFTQQGGASYRPQQAQQQSAESLSLDDVMQGGAPSAFSKDDPIGTSVEGEIVEIRAEQQTDFTTGEPLYYPNGKPKPQVVIHLQTTMTDPNRIGDSGIRGVYVKGYNIGQLRLACRQAGVGDHPNVGDHLKATFARTQPAKTRGFNDAKIYDYIVTPKKTADLTTAMNDPQAGMTQQQPAQPVQQVTFSQPAGLTAQERQQVLQLKSLGKTPQEIAGLLGKTVDQVVNAVGAGSGQEPEF
jgi:DNA-binding CsgD family transcriptional regulator